MKNKITSVPSMPPDRDVAFVLGLISWNKSPQLVVVKRPTENGHVFVACAIFSQSVVLPLLVPDSVIVPLIPEVVSDLFKAPQLVVEIRSAIHTEIPVTSTILRQPVTLVLHILDVVVIMTTRSFFKPPHLVGAVWTFLGASILVSSAPLGEFGMWVYLINDEEFVTIYLDVLSKIINIVSYNSAFVTTLVQKVLFTCNV